MQTEKTNRHAEKVKSYQANLQAIRQKNKEVQKQLQQEIKILQDELKKQQVGESSTRHATTSTDSTQADLQALSLANDDLHNRLEVQYGFVTSLQDALRARHLKSTPSYSLFWAYELQRDVLLEVIDFDKGTTLTRTEFDHVWVQIRPIDNQQNLLCEVLVRGDLTLDDWSVL